MCTLNIVLGRGGGGTKAFMFLCTHKSTAPWSPVIWSNSLGQGRGGGQKRSCSSAHTKALHLDRLSSQAIVLGRGGGGDKSVHVPLHKQKYCTLIACHLKQCTLNIVLGRGAASAVAYIADGSPIARQLSRIYQSIYLSTYLPIYLSICLSVCLSICLSVYLSICGAVLFSVM